MAPSPVAQPLRLECNGGRCTASTAAFVGTGIIEFGLDYDRETGALIDKRVSFSRWLRRFAYSASFSHGSGYPIHWAVSRVSDDGTELLVYTELADTDDPGVWPQLVERRRMAAIVDHRRGRYVLRFYGGAVVDPARLLAEGRFELT